MIKKNQKIINILNMLSDGIIIFLSYFVSLFIRFVVMKGTISLILWRYPYTLVAVLYSLSMVFFYYAMKMYGSYRFKAVGAENLTIVTINGIGVMSLMAVMYLLRLADFSRSVLMIYWAVSTVAIILKRFIVRKILHHYRRLGYNQKHVIIVGNGHHAFQYIEDLKRNPQLGITVDGYVSKYQKEGLGKCLGSYEELETILRENDIDELIVALEPHEIHFMKYVISCADKEGVRLSLIPFFNDYFPTHVRMERVGKSKLIDMRATPLDNLMAGVVKRVIDICGSVFGIIVLSPVMLITAIGVKLSSPGPILFKQDRIGLNKKPFKMLKFRSMRVNTTEQTAISGIEVKRLSGETRYDTNLKILKEAGMAGEEILVSTGEAYADSLSASATGKPILLIHNKKEISQEQIEYLESINIKKIYILGGEIAIPKKYEKTLSKYGEIERIYGDTRYETSVKIANKFFETPSYAIIAYGENYPDGLCGGPLAQATKATLILTKENKKDIARNYMQEMGIESGAVLGGDSNIIDDTAMYIFGVEKIVTE